MMKSIEISAPFLRVDDYEALGGVRGSIEAVVESAFADPSRRRAVAADKAERERLLRAGFIPWLARVDPHTDERKRRVARWDEIPDTAHHEPGSSIVR